MGRTMTCTVVYSSIRYTVTGVSSELKILHTCFKSLSMLCDTSSRIGSILELFEQGEASCGGELCCLNADICPAENVPSPMAQVPSIRSPIALNKGKALEQNVLTVFALLGFRFCGHICVSVQ